VTVHQLQVVALPRRFSMPMQDIWLLQSRFPQRKRTGRLLAHPRFRAAFDFLMLREVASPEHADDVAFWREAQSDPANAGLVESREDADVAGAPRPRRRRRRRRDDSQAG
jgi:poly(A) polymerase